jgi:hypothetical protein
VSRRIQDIPAPLRRHVDDMPNIIQETSYRLSGKIGFAAERQNNFSALVIILSANNYTYDMEEGATHEKI